MRLSVQLKFFILVMVFPGTLTGAANGSDFPAPFNSEQDTGSTPMPADRAAADAHLPAGFHAEVFAAEPDVQNPIAMAWDSRGRLWIAENYTYAERTQQFEFGLRDRVLILADEDGDGRCDSRKVFTDEVQLLTSLEVGHGGVWLMCPPRLLFLPDRNDDDAPDGPVEVVLDGFDVPRENYHNFANGLHWGPDGWLYGRCGGSCPGRIGKPSTPESERTPLAGGIWRYHPVRGDVEVLTAGTTNPWGHDWNAHGEAFFVNTVNGHLWHLIPGAHFVRPSTLDPNPRVYELIDHHADHWHFDTGKSWTESRDGAANELGGGHAHSGTMIYLGDNWPAEYRGGLFTLNLHGRRINHELLERFGSGYVARHGVDFFVSADPWFRGIDLSYGPDGGVFVLDWSDTGECHENTGVHRTSGRIYKITYGRPQQRRFGDLRSKTDRELVELHRAQNEWFVRQARLVLAERAAAGSSLSEARKGLRALFDAAPASETRLRALLSLAVIGAADHDFLLAHLSHADPYVRAWAVRLLSDTWPLDGVMGPVKQSFPRAERVASEVAAVREPLLGMARTDPSSLVRLVLASTLQRLPVPRRPELAAALVSHAEDASDHNLPLLVWYGLIPVADADPISLVDVARSCQWPVTRRLLTRRLAEDLAKEPEPLNAVLAMAVTSRDNVAVQRDVLEGLSEATRGWRKAPKPRVWKTVQQQLANSADPALRDLVRQLSVVFGDGRALDEIRHLALDRSASTSARMAALETLIESRPDDLRSVCERLLSESHVNLVAARGLALFDDPEIGKRLVDSLRRFREPQRVQVISILASRPTFAHSLLAAVQEGKVARAQLTAFHVRQMQNLGDDELSRKLAQVWGEMRDSPEEKRRYMAELKASLTPDVLSGADKSQGRLVFQTVCAKCHRLYGEGEQIGPDLTGSHRSNLDYLLENVVDPSAVLNADYRMSVFRLVDGRVLNGLVTATTERTITLQALTEKHVIDRSDIKSSQATSLSPMPDGLLETLSADQVKNLVAYLQHPSQVPLPAVTAR